MISAGGVVQNSGENGVGQFAGGTGTLTISNGGELTTGETFDVTMSAVAIHRQLSFSSIGRFGSSSSLTWVGRQIVAPASPRTAPSAASTASAGCTKSPTSAPSPTRPRPRVRLALAS